MEDRRVKSALKQAIHLRNYQRARGRALTRLANLHPTDYKKLYQEEKERDELEGKKWTHIGDTAIPRVARPPEVGTRATTTEGSSRRDGAEASPRNDGAEA